MILFILLAGMYCGWILRQAWDRWHPCYVVIPAIMEGVDNTAVIQEAVDLAKQLGGSMHIIRCKPGIYAAGTVHF